jgi:tetratricopeptide (TPR) repeat protein
LSHLAKLNDLTVIARTSVLRYAGARKPIQEIGRELNVESVMECSVRYADGQVRITTQLIDAFTEAQLWSETYTRPFENIFAIETDIATQVAAALEAELAPDEQRKLNKPPTTSAEAYAFYLRAINAVRYEAGGLGVSEGDVAEFRRYIDRALELDPEFALALAAKARDYAYAIARPIERSAGLGPEDLATLAVASAERALALDPETGLAHAALSVVHRFYWRERDARLALENALALSPNDYQVLFDAVLLSMYTERHEAALQFAERVARINPEEGFLPLALARLWKGDIDEAVALLERNDRYLYIKAQAEMLRGRREEALRLVNRVAEQSTLRPPNSFSNMAYLYRRLGAEAEALGQVARFEEYAEDYVVGPGERAVAALSAGNRAEALEWLRRAAARPTPGPDWLSLHTILTNRLSDPVLDQPEFVDVRSRLGWR